METSTSPNGMATAFLQLGGTMRYMLWDTKAVLPLVKAAKKVDQLTMTDFVSALEDFTDADLFKLNADQGLKVLVVEQLVNDVLYLPAGWLFSAMSLTGPLFYGARKTFLCGSTLQVENYSLIHGLYSHQGKKIDRMAAALQAMEPAE